VSPKWGLPLWVIRSGSRRQRVTPERDQTQAAIPTIPGARAVAAAPRANSDPRGASARTLAVGHLRRLRAGLGNRGQQGAGSAGLLLRQPEVHRNGAAVWYRVISPVNTGLRETSKPPLPAQ